LRILDTAAQGTGTLVYRLFSVVCESMKLGFAKNKHLIRKNPELLRAFQNAADLVMEKWNSFHYPVLAAACVLAPMNSKFVLEMRDESFDEYRTLLDETISVLVDCFIRQDPYEVSIRKKPLSRTDPNDDILIADFKKDCLDDIVDFLERMKLFIYSNYQVMDHLRQKIKMRLLKWLHGSIGQTMLRPAK
jgi:hypothetical protein